MNKLLPLLLTLCLPALLSQPQHRNFSTAYGSIASSLPKTPDTISLAFYNVENLFDLFYNGNEYPEFRPGALGWNKQTQEKKLSNIASVIKTMNPDIIGLCEVENMQALKDLQQAIKKSGVTYPYRAFTTGPYKTMTSPALLSKFPLRKTTSFGGGTGEARAQRNILEAEIDAPGHPITVFVNHWPSKQHKESQRLALAHTLEKRVRTLPTGTDYIIMGDLNCDYDEWASFHTKRLDDTRGRVGLNAVLKTTYTGTAGTIEYVNEPMIASIDSLYHYDLWLSLPENKRASHFYRGIPGTLDHILVPHALFDKTGWSYVHASFSVFTWNNKLMRNNAAWRWQMKGYGKRRFHVGEGYSDHLPIHLRIARKPYAPLKNALAVSEKKPASAPTVTKKDGFESTTEGWVGCGSGVTVSRDSTNASSGRFSLRIEGPAFPKNQCVAHTIIERTTTNRSRQVLISFAIKGQGNLVLRIRSGTGKWVYYNAAFSKMSSSARYLPAKIPTWKQVSLSFTSDTPGSSDIELELRAGKEAGCRFWVDEVRIK